MSSLPLPREIESDACVGALRARLAGVVAPLWSGARVAVPTVPFTRELAGALARARDGDDVVLGLETAAAALDREAHGLAVADARAGHDRTARVSRLLVIANDGAERFHREVERIAVRHAARLLVCRVDASAAALGLALAGRAARVKAVLVTHKDAVTAVLRALAEPA
jgi:hypothetical protein